MASENYGYYTLRYQRSDNLHKAGERIAAANSILRIGQQPDSDVDFANSTNFTDELFAVIKPTEDGWVLIPCSDFVATYVNGMPISLMATLRDGDIISFSDSQQELLFNVHTDSTLDLSKGNLHIRAGMPKGWIATFILVPLALFIFLGWNIWDIRRHDSRIHALLDEVRESVLQISVDSVYFCQIVGNDTTKLLGYSYSGSDGHAISGTAFLTTDGLIVTARHCIEPWLNTRDALEKSISEISSLPVRWAMEAETYNQTHEGDTVFKLITVCELSKENNIENGPSFDKMLSSDFIYDDSLDEIIELGDFDNAYYWRSIMRRYARTDMMLGDIAMSSFPMDGKIQLADTANLASLAAEGRELHVLGFPNFKERGLSHAEGKVRLPYSEGRLIAHDGNLIHGYSGAPTMVVDDDRVYAIGVVSVTDETGGNRMYSVPVTALKKGDAK